MSLSSLTKRKPSSFRSKDSGIDRKVYPVFDGTKPLQSSKFIDPSRAQVHEIRMQQTSLKEFKEFEAAINQYLNDMKLYGQYRQKLKQDALKEKHDHPWIDARQAVLIAREEEDKVLRHNPKDPFYSGTKRSKTSEEFIKGYDVLREGVKHPEVSYRAQSRVGPGKGQILFMYPEPSARRAK